MAENISDAGSKPEECVQPLNWLHWLMKGAGTTADNTVGCHGYTYKEVKKVSIQFDRFQDETY